MARDLAAINKARALQGLAPLEKLPGDDAPTGGGAPGDDPAAGGGSGGAPAGGAPTGGAPAGTPPADPPIELNDEQLLAALNRKGIAVTSFDDLLPKGDPTKEAELRENNKLSFALNKGLFSTKEYENFVREKSNPRDLVFAQFFEEARTEDPNATAEDIQAEFEEKYGLGAEPTSRKYKRGETEIGLLADRILRQRYGKIYNAEDAYSKHETTEKATRTRNNTILAKAPIYRKDVEDIMGTLTKINVPFGENESYEVPVPAEALEAMKSKMLDTDYCAQQIIGGYTKEGLKEIAHAALIQENFAALTQQVAQQYALKKQAGVKGIPPAGPGERRQRKELSPDQMKVLADNNIKVEDLPSVNAN